MLTRLQRFFERHMQPGTTGDASPIEHRLQLATAVLLIEVMHVDEHIDPAEIETVHRRLLDRFRLSEAERNDLLALAGDKKRQATDYYEFTSLLNRHFDQIEKVRLVEDLWSIAYADGHLDKHEEHVIRKLADLLHVPHSAFIRSKHRASQAPSS